MKHVGVDNHQMNRTLNLDHKYFLGLLICFDSHKTYIKPRFDDSIKIYSSVLKFLHTRTKTWPSSLKSTKKRNSMSFYRKLASMQFRTSLSPGLTRFINTTKEQFSSIYLSGTVNSTPFTKTLPISISFDNNRPLYGVKPLRKINSLM